MTDVDEARSEGLRLAVELHAARTPLDPFAQPLAQRVIETAGEFAAWLLAPPARLQLIPAPFTFQQGAPGPGTPTRTGVNGMSVTMTDSMQVGYTVDPVDSKGFQVSDTLTWSSDDGGAVLTVTPSADGLSCNFAAVAPGTATISVTDGTLSSSDLITVTTGSVASLVLTAGTPTSE